MLTAITYLDDLGPGGGGTNYWPNSIHPVHAYMLAPGRSRQGVQGLT
jgi:hypothetical protein